MSRRGARVWIVSAALLLAALLLSALSAGFPLYSAGLRAGGLYVSSAFSAVFSVVPFPLSEIILLALLPALIVLFVLKMRKYGAGRGAMRALRALVCLICAAALLFSINLGVHYGAPSVAAQIGLYVGRYSTGQLSELCDVLLERANHYAALAPRNAARECDYGAFGNQAGSVMDAYHALSVDTLAGYDFSMFRTPRTAPPKKALILSVVMSYLDIAGYYFPWTAEEIVSGDTLDMTLPFTIAHEAAHGFGVAAEDEANFAAFLACSRSADTRLLYSAYFNAYIYASNALYAADYALWEQNAAGRGELLALDLARLSEHLAKYDTPVRDIGTAINDGFIRATGQPEGVRTYGKVVDLLLALHFGVDGD